ncbi:hypothetical protein FH972_022243 [Carpinus fangiana]|uniref:Uncharacterized protein n=1 Tax=Carpinus fangiana TaxID=176857 RepID=A0A5N6KS10_9ROSI|nr:hypothetical protein FH972_022243 [Carpinus fangiana]
MMQFTVLALALAAAANAQATYQAPIVTLTTYTGTSCEDSTQTGSIAASPPVGVCQAAAPGTNSVQVSIPANSASARGCQIQLFGTPDCNSPTYRRSYEVSPGELDCKQNIFMDDNYQVQSVHFVCPE